MRYFTVALLLLVCTASLSLDPPVKLWERQYTFPGHSGCFFRDVELTPEGNLFVTGYSLDFSDPDTSGHVAFLIDVEGNVIWSVDFTSYSMLGQDGAVLPDGSMVLTGYGQAGYGASRRLFIMKIDTGGNPEWTRYYDYPETKEEGYGITCLPDGGFAVCGLANGEGLWGQAWLLRTDSAGDTLWTDIWGPVGTKGVAIEHSNNELCMLSYGLSDSLPTLGTHLLFYDLDGNYLRGTDYGSTLYYLTPASFCTTSDGGYTFTTESWPPVWHTDQYGETLWWQSIYVTPNDWHKGYCIRTTMDSGYIFCGWDGYYEYEPDGRLVDYEEGWLARFDSEGNELWNINNTISVNHHFYSCLQLPEGGYIACGAYGVFENMDDDSPTSRGSTGFLVRYAPETGITEPDPPNSLTLEVSPNPCSSVLALSFSLPETGHVSLRIYDLSGRLVSTTVDGVFPAGSNTVDCTVPEGIPSGCYLVHLTAGQENVTRNLVLLR